MAQDNAIAMQSIRLVLAAPDAGLLQELRGLAAPRERIDVRGEACDGAEALRAVRELRPDVLLLDDALCGDHDACSESPLLRAIHADSPSTKVVLLCGHCTERGIARAFQQGARGCVSHDTTLREVLHAVRAVAAGELWVGRKALAAVVDELLSRLQRRDFVAAKWAQLLSERELDVANGVRRGLTNKEIARTLRISDTTVKSHLENIFHKLNVSRRVQLALLTRGLPAQRWPGNEDDGDAAREGGGPAASATG